jgi:hypothetical protein
MRPTAGAWLLPHPEALVSMVMRRFSTAYALPMLLVRTMLRHVVVDSFESPYLTHHTEPSTAYYRTIIAHRLFP